MCGLYVPEQKELFTPGGGLGGNVELVVADANGKVVDKIQGKNAIMPWVLFDMWCMLNTTSSATYNSNYIDTAGNGYPTFLDLVGGSSTGSLLIDVFYLGYYTGTIPSGTIGNIGFTSSDWSQLIMTQSIQEPSWNAPTSSQLESVSFTGNLAFTSAGYSIISPTSSQINFVYTNSVTTSISVNCLGFAPNDSQSITAGAINNIWYTNGATPNYKNITGLGNVGDIIVSTFYMAGTPVTIPGSGTITINYTLTATI